MLGGLVALLLVNTLLLATPPMLAKIIDLFVPSGPIASSGASSAAAQPAGGFSFGAVLAWSCLLLAVEALIFFFRLCWRRLIIFPSFTIERDVRMGLFRHILSLCKKSMRDYSVGTQISLINRETSQLSDAISWGTMALVDGLFTIVSVSIITLILYPGMVWAALLLYPLTSITLYLVWRKTGPLYGAVQERTAKVAELTRQMFTHIGDIKAHTSEQFYAGRFEREGNAILSMRMRVAALEGMLWPSALLVHGLAFVATLFLGLRQIQMGNASIGDLFAVMNYLVQIQLPFLGLGFALSIQQQGLANARRINALFNTKSALVEYAPPVTTPIRGALCVRGVSFSYPETVEDPKQKQEKVPEEKQKKESEKKLKNESEQKPAKPFALSDISFDMPAGSWLGITGSIGSGKSTLAMLLSRVYDPAQGDITWDGVPVRQYARRTLHEHVLFQTQNFQLFSATIAQNIAFSLKPLSAAEKRRALACGRLSSLDADVRIFKDKWDTQIGEGGVRLSGGQKQRIALARALYCGAQVLILDDIFSGLDNKTTKTVIENLRETRTDKTTILITHNLPLLSNTERIIVMENGRIRERGTHEELLVQSKEYLAQWKEYLITQGEYLA